MPEVQLKTTTTTDLMKPGRLPELFGRVSPDIPTKISSSEDVRDEGNVAKCLCGSLHLQGSGLNAGGQVDDHLSMEVSEKLDLYRLN